VYVSIERVAAIRRPTASSRLRAHVCTGAEAASSASSSIFPLARLLLLNPGRNEIAVVFVGRFVGGCGRRVEDVSDHLVTPAFVVDERRRLVSPIVSPIVGVTHIITGVSLRRRPLRHQPRTFELEIDADRARDRTNPPMHEPVVDPT
jgi:hypothetical protein